MAEIKKLSEKKKFGHVLPISKMNMKMKLQKHLKNHMS